MDSEHFSLDARTRLCSRDALEYFEHMLYEAETLSNSSSSSTATADYARLRAAYEMMTREIRENLMWLHKAPEYYDGDMQSAGALRHSHPTASQDSTGCPQSSQQPSVRMPISNIPPEWDAELARAYARVPDVLDSRVTAQDFPYQPLIPEPPSYIADTQPSHNDAHSTGSNAHQGQTLGTYPGQDADRSHGAFGSQAKFDAPWDPTDDIISLSSGDAFDEMPVPSQSSDDGIQEIDRTEFSFSLRNSRQVTGASSTVQRTDSSSNRKETPKPEFVDLTTSGVKRESGINWDPDVDLTIEGSRPTADRRPINLSHALLDNEPHKFASLAGFPGVSDIHPRASASSLQYNVPYHQPGLARFQSGYLANQQLRLWNLGGNGDLPTSVAGPSNLGAALQRPSYENPHSGRLGPPSLGYYGPAVSQQSHMAKDDIKSLLENIQPAEVPPEDREPTPEAMRYPLMEHQKIGLSWMIKMEEGSNHGGILADDMGLGKTIQALALIASRKSTNPRLKTNLIIAPVALTKQWEREVQTKLKQEHQLSTYVLHGSKRKTSWSKLRDFDIVLTTFGTLASEYKNLQAWRKRQDANPDLPSSDAPNLPLLGKNSRWYRVIIDEAQCIKNRTTKAAQGACELKAESRFVLTGTPMMNGVNELHSLIEFLRIRPYCDIKRFNADFSIPLKSQNKGTNLQAMRKLQALLKAILLRRTKQSKLDGQPIINLPPRTTEIKHAVFDADQTEFYESLEQKLQLQFNKYLRAGTVGKNYSSVLVLLLRLRQAACHPHLIHDFGQELSGVPDVSMEEMVRLAEQLAAPVVTRLKGIEAFECPVCYDAVENPQIFIPCGHDTCAECFAKITDQATRDGLRDGNENPDVTCPKCRAKISTKGIIDYNIFKRVHQPELLPVAQGSSSAEADGVIEEAADDNEDEAEDSGEHPGDSEDDDYVDKEARDEDGQPLRKRTKKDLKGKGKARARKPDPIQKSLATLKKEGMRNADARRAYMRRLEEDWVPSAKVDKCIEILANVLQPGGGGGEKTIIFSQFTSLLDLLEVPLRQRGWRFNRYDGTMSATQRNDAVLDFTDSDDCRIMLVSLKAGNAGLNLVAASQVIILDPFWNPFVEEQAVDRTHRIGQLRPVCVHRILVEGTVEDRIIELQERKRRTINQALDEKEAQDVGRLGVRELAYLFGVGPR